MSPRKAQEADVLDEEVTVFAKMSFLAVLLLLMAHPVPAHGQEPIEARVSFTTLPSTYQDGPSSVAGTLNVPARQTDRLPAVVILHSSGGVDGRGAAYAAALNKAGIATLEIEMFSRGQTVQTHPTVQQNMPHVFGALEYLTSRPEIDPTRIGVMGFSWGGMLSIVAATDRFTNEFTQGKRRFKAHLALYPVCWIHSSVLEGTAMASPHKFLKLERDAYLKFTGAPVLILAAEKDDYEDSDSCARFVAEANKGEGAAFVQITYAGVYHGWDGPRDAQSTSPLANKGRGGTWRGYANAEAAERSRRDAVQFFAKNL